MFVLLAIFLLAIFLILVGNLISLPRLQAGGAAILGLGLVAVGVGSLRSRRFEIGVDPGSTQSSSKFRFKGAGAMFWGMMVLTLGLITLTASLVIVLGMGSAAERIVLDRPGFVIAPLGALFLCTALGWLSGTEEMNSSLLMILVTLPHRIGVVITLLFSLAVLGIGLFELAAPQEFDRIIASLKPPPAPEVPARWTNPE